MWGSSYLFIAIGLEGLRPLAIAFVRVALGGALVVCVPAARRSSIEREDWPRIVLLGLLWLAVPLALYPVAQRHVSSSVAGMVTGSQPLFAAAIAALLLQRFPRRRAIAGLAVGFSGVAVVVLSTAGGSSSSLGGIALILAAVVCYAVATNMAVPLQQRYGALGVILRAQAVALVVLTVPGLIALRSSSATAGSFAAMIPLGFCPRVPATSPSRRWSVARARRGERSPCSSSL